MLEIKRYEPKNKEEWDRFILSAKNGHFMFCRNYMDYHSDRFTDHSLMFYDDRELLAVLPANINNNILYSHQGLTFGGLVLDSNTSTPIVMELVDELIRYSKDLKLQKIIYKHIPHIYSKNPAQEDFYALFNKGAKLSRVDISSTIDLQSKPELSSRRKRGVKKAEKSGLKIVKTQDFKSFHKILSETLAAKHNTSPTHSFSEIELLASRFPENISLYSTTDNAENTLASVLIFEMNHWAHAQYIVASEEGKKLGALDLLFHELIFNIYRDKKYFDFGISTESQGKVLNTGLITQKEEFGASAIVHNFFELELT